MARIPSNSARVAWQSSSLYSRICFCTVSSLVSKTGKRKKYAPASGQDRPCIRSLEGGAVWVVTGALNSGIFYFLTLGNNILADSLDGRFVTSDERSTSP